MKERFPTRRATAAIVRARRAPVLEPLEPRHLMSGWSPVGPETLVNDATAGIQETTYESHKAIASDDNGRYVVVWSGSGTRDPDGIYARLYDGSGPRGPSFRVNTWTTGVQTEAAVAMDNAGNFVVVWSSNGQDGAGWGVYGQRYDAAGVAQGGEFRVNTTTAGDQYQPSVAADDDDRDLNADGGFVITWTSANIDSSGLGIAGQRFDAAGLAQGGEFRVNAYTTGDQRYSAVAMDDAGNFSVVWESYFQLTTTTYSIGIALQRYTVAGAPIGTGSIVNTTTAGLQLAPAIGMNALGAFVVAWTSDTEDGNNTQDGSGRGIFARRYTADGAETGEFGVNATTAGDQQHPSVAIDSTGAFVIAWESAAQDAGGWDAYAREYTAAGAPIADEFRLNTTTTGDQQNVSVAMVGNGDYVSAWSGAGAGDESGVFLQRYEDLAPGVTVTPTSGLVTNESGATATFTVVLDSRPAANVTISITSSDTTEGTASDSLLTFTRNNWSLPQQVIVTGVSDTLNDGPVMYTIETGATSSSDPDYSGRAVADVSVRNVDNTPPPNSSPTVATTGSTLQYVENSGAVAADPGVTVADPNNEKLAGAVVTIVGFVPGQDVLGFTSAGAISVVWDAASGTLTLSGVATVAEYQAALRAVTYLNNSDNPTLSGRSVRFVVNDGRADSAAAERSVTVNAVNDPPVASDDRYTAEQGTALSIGAAAGVLANDTDVDDGVLSAVLVQQTAHGVVSLFADGGFVYTPAAGFVGTDRFTYSVTDSNGSATAEVTIAVEAIAGAEPPTEEPPTEEPPTEEPPTEEPPTEERPTVVPPPAAPLSLPKDEPDVEEDPAPAVPPPDDVPLVVITPRVSMQPELGGQDPLWAEVSSEPASAGALRMVKSKARASNGNVLPPLRIVQRRASQERSEDGSEATREPADGDRGRAAVGRGNAVPRIASVAGAPPAALVTAVGPLATKLEAMTRHLGAADAADSATIRTVSQVALAMTAGYVLWSLRGASLLASLVTSLPLWRSLDPLPILEARADRDKAKAAAKRRKAARRKQGAHGPGGQGDDDDKLASLVN